MRKSGAPSFRQVGIGSNFNSSHPNTLKKLPVGPGLQAFKAVVPIPNATRDTAQILGLLARAPEMCDTGEGDVEAVEEQAGNLSEEKAEVSYRPTSVPQPLETSRSASRENIQAEPENSTVNSKAVSGKRIYTVVWGKQSTKKHKTYESDGTLEVVGKSVILKDEDGKIIGRSSLKCETIEDGLCLNVGSKAVQITELATSTVQHDNNTNSTKRTGETESPPARSYKKMKKVSNVCVPIGVPNHRGFQLDYEPLVMPRPSNDIQWKCNEQRLPLVDVSVDPCLARVLRPHQRAGVVFLYECVMGLRDSGYHGAILADEMGLGKTLQCIALTWILLKQGPYGGKATVNRVLIVTPSSLVVNWRKEFLQWLGRERIQTFVVDQKNKPKEFRRLANIPIMLISYEMFVRYFDDIQSIRFDLLICDEGHRLKNTTIRTSSLLAQLECQKRVLLTGTPIQNDLQEFFALVDFVNPGILGSISLFRKHFEEPIVSSRQPDISQEVSRLGEERVAELNRLTSKFILRRTQEVNDKYLTRKQESVVFCTPTSLQKDVYKAAVGYWNDRVSGSGSGGVAHLGVITALKKICNHPSLVRQVRGTTAAGKVIGQRVTPSSIIELENIPVEENLTQHLANMLPSDSENVTSYAHSGKLNVVVALMEYLSTTNEKIVLVSYFTQTLDMFASLCDRKKYKYCRLDGSTPTGQRMEIVNKFNGPYSQHFVFLLSARAGGVGLNLTGASRLVLYDSDWNPATDLQAMARIWRDGQKKSVHIYRLLTTGTIEEKIYQRQISKTGLSGTVVDPHNTSAIRLSNEELKDLFTFHEDCHCLTHDLMDCHCRGDGIIPGVPESLADVVEDLEEEENSQDGLFSSQRDCQLQISGEKLPEKQSLRMNQLYQWEHHATPFNLTAVKEMGLNNASQFITFMFRNSSV